MKNKISILQVTGSWRRKSIGGIASFLLGYYLEFDEEKYQVEFLTLAYPVFDYFQDEIESRGGRISCLNVHEFRGFWGKIRYLRSFRKFLSSRQYDIIHFHQGSFYTLFLGSLYSRLFGKGAKVISHSHSNLPTYHGLSKISMRLLKPLFSSISDHVLACSQPAGEYMFPTKLVSSNRFQVMKNAVDPDKFSFDSKTRIEMRRKLDIADLMVIGHVGSFSYAKNHSFVISLFHEFQKLYPSSFLVLVGGGGEDFIREAEKLVEKLELSDKVLFTGPQKNVSDYMHAMDLLLLPSHYEGLAVVLVEAQCNGLPSLASNVIPDEVMISPIIDRLSLTDSKDKWIERMIQLSREERKDGSGFILEAGYDVKSNAKVLETLYYSLANNM